MLLLAALWDAVIDVRRHYRPRRHAKPDTSRRAERRRAISRLKRACGKSSAITTIIGERMERIE